MREKTFKGKSVRNGQGSSVVLHWMLLDPARIQIQEAQDAVTGWIKSLREGIHLGGALGRRCSEAQSSPYLQLKKGVLPGSNSGSVENEAHGIDDQESSLQFRDDTVT